MLALCISTDDFAMCMRVAYTYYVYDAEIFWKFCCFIFLSKVGLGTQKLQ